MKNHALMAALMAGAALSACPPASAQVTRYYGEMRTAYSDFQDRTACPLGSHGSCQDFPRTARLAGWFETAAPLQPNLDESEIRALVTSYSFSDGLNTYSSSDPDVRAFIFRVSTDSGSNIVKNRIHLQRWLTGSNPHRSINEMGPGGSPNDVDMLSRFEMATEQVGAMNNAMCASLFSETSLQVSYSGESDTCLGTYEVPDNGVSVAWTGAPVQNQNVMSWHREAVHPALSLTQHLARRPGAGGAGGALHHHRQEYGDRGRHPGADCRQPACRPGARHLDLYARHQHAMSRGVRLRIAGGHGARVRGRRLAGFHRDGQRGQPGARNHYQCGHRECPGTVGAVHASRAGRGNGAVHGFRVHQYAGSFPRRWTGDPRADAAAHSPCGPEPAGCSHRMRSEEHTSEL